MKSFEAITVEEHSEIEEVLIKAVNDQFRKEKFLRTISNMKLCYRGISLSQQCLWMRLQNLLS